MYDIIFKEITKDIEDQIVDTWGDWVIKYGCLHYGEGCYSLAALYGGEPVGFISAYPLRFPEPLQEYCDAYIDDIEVREDFRKQGIASKLLLMTEQWAKSHGYRQIRAWSSDDKTEALGMWYAFGYGVCPAVMRGECVVKEFVGKPIYGFYVVKTL